MSLQAQASAGKHHDALDLVVGLVLQHPVETPRPLLVATRLDRGHATHLQIARQRPMIREAPRPTSPDGSEEPADTPLTVLRGASVSTSDNSGGPVADRSRRVVIPDGR
jgi:hypothetical protein